MSSEYPCIVSPEEGDKLELRTHYANRVQLSVFDTVSGEPGIAYDVQIDRQSTVRLMHDLQQWLEDSA